MNEALELSLDNVPRLAGKTLVAVDTSGSMSGKPSQIASLFGAVIAKTNDADILTFNDSARYHDYNPGDTLTTIASGLKFTPSGTNFHSIFDTANKKYDRIIILSDMQAWVGYHTPKDAFARYRTRTKCEPLIYSFDLQGLGSLQFPEAGVVALAGFSDKIFDIMAMVETDKNALINEIEKISL